MVRAASIVIGLGVMLAGCSAVRPRSYECPPPPGVTTLSAIEAYEASLLRPSHATRARSSRAR